MSAKKNQIIKLFNIPSTEVIFADFGCSYNTMFIQQGRMFVSEHYICFYAKLFGRKVNIAIPFESLVQIEKSTLYGIFENTITLKDKQKRLYKFSSFTDRDRTYNLLIAIWKKEPISLSSQQEDPDIQETETDQTLLFKTQLNMTEEDFIDKYIYSSNNFLNFQGLVFSEWQEQDGSQQRTQDGTICFEKSAKLAQSKIHRVQQFLMEPALKKSTIQIITNYPDLPSNDCYRSEERWEVVVVSQNTLNVSCNLQVVFLKSCYLKNEIQQTITKEITIRYHRWLEEMVRFANQNPPPQPPALEYAVEDNQLFEEQRINKERPKSRAGSFFQEIPLMFTERPNFRLIALVISFVVFLLMILCLALAQIFSLKNQIGELNIQMNQLHQRLTTLEQRL